MITGFTVTSAPLLVNGYLLGEFGIVITAAAAVAAALVGRLVPRDIEDHDRSSKAPGPDHASRTNTGTRRLDSRCPQPVLGIASAPPVVTGCTT